MKSLRLLAPLVIAAMLTACHDLPDYDNTATGNFDALWTEMDRHYCFFEEKGIDWQATGERYRSQIVPGMGRQALFRVMADMLGELRDGHVNLSAPFGTSYYRGWWSDYPADYQPRLVEQYYLGFSYSQLADVSYAPLLCGIGYVRWPSFEMSLGHGNIDYILSAMASCQGLIIDIRDNGGGNVDNADNLAAHFVSTRTLGGYIMHKTGPGHSDFSEPYPIHIDPVEGGHIIWSRPVVLLTNRGTFSAANYFTGLMKALPQVTVVGATTGGGGGMPYSLELPCGWGVRFSACPVLDADGRCTEAGVEPHPGCEVHLDPLLALQGRDTMLDFAIELLTRKTTASAD